MADHGRLVQLRLWMDRDRIQWSREQQEENDWEKCPKLPGVSATKAGPTQARESRK